MVTSGTFFRQYFRGRAQLWERQSLLRARVLSGLPEDRSAAESLIAEALTGESLPDGWVNEMRAMRKRIERERTKAPRGSTDLKTGPGGLLDIEFAVQALQLDAGMRHGMQRIPGTVAAVRRLTSDGNLKKGIGRLLEMNYLWLRQLELYMRMNATEGGGSWPCGKDLSGIIATAMGEKGAVALDRRLRSILGANRSLMETILDDLMKERA
jgi:glutamate-ammonia-ligase adenylyltransferase